MDLDPHLDVEDFKNMMRKLFNSALEGWIKRIGHQPGQDQTPIRVHLMKNHPTVESAFQSISQEVGRGQAKDDKGTAPKTK